MYELVDTSFGNIKNVVVYGTCHVVAHVMHTDNGYSVWEQGALWEGDELVADVESWQHGLQIWEVYATS